MPKEISKHPKKLATSKLCGSSVARALNALRDDVQLLEPRPWFEANMQVPRIAAVGNAIGQRSINQSINVMVANLRPHLFMY